MIAPTKRPPGRPRLSDAERQIERFTLRAQSAWLRRVEAAARRKGVSLSRYLREAAEQRMKQGD